MTEIEKQVAIMQQQKEIDKRCSFFRILTDAGIKKDKPENHQPLTTNNKLQTLNS